MGSMVYGFLIGFLMAACLQMPEGIFDDPPLAVDEGLSGADFMDILIDGLHPEGVQVPEKIPDAYRADPCWHARSDGQRYP